jgi:hypothetical protein
MSRLRIVNQEVKLNFEVGLKHPKRGWISKFFGEELARDDPHDPIPPLAAHVNSSLLTERERLQNGACQPTTNRLG